MFYIECLAHRRLAPTDRYENGLRLYSKVSMSHFVLWSDALVHTLSRYLFLCLVLLQYIAIGAPMELNISSVERSELAALYGPDHGGTRAKLDAWIAARLPPPSPQLQPPHAQTLSPTGSNHNTLMAPGTPSGSAPPMRGSVALAKALKRTEFDACRHGVRRLLMTNSWPRFVSSIFYRAACDAVRSLSQQQHSAVLALTASAASAAGGGGGEPHRTSATAAGSASPQSPVTAVQLATLKSHTSISPALNATTATTSTLTSAPSNASPTVYPTAPTAIHVNSTPLRVAVSPLFVSRPTSSSPALRASVSKYQMQVPADGTGAGLAPMSLPSSPTAAAAAAAEAADKAALDALQLPGAATPTFH
jgi:hypothetical protein